MIEELFEHACLIRGSLKRFHHVPEISSLGDRGVEAEAEAHAWVLAQYLQFMGSTSVFVVSAQRDGVGYTWVEADGASVDICAHRLPGSETVLVLSEQSVFHSLFEGTERARLTKKAIEARPDYVTAYDVLLARNPVLKNPTALETRSV